MAIRLRRSLTWRLIPMSRRNDGANNAIPKKLAMKPTVADFQAFSKTFDSVYEDRAVRSRGEFLRFFPLEALQDLTLDQYVIGKDPESFCSLAEVKSKDWANMQGSTAWKFGIYYGRTKPDPNKKYRPAKRFGASAEDAFRSVKRELLDLVAAGKTRDFEAIDGNPLSQMFKAKVLSLYFPDDFINICSAEHLRKLASHFDLRDGLPVSQYQHLLQAQKTGNSHTRSWSNPKFMSFLYQHYLPKGAPAISPQVVALPVNTTRARAKPIVDFDELQEAWGKIGRMSEDYARNWEEARLKGLGLDPRKIKDCRDRPAYGYDFFSHAADSEKRCIEVKSLGADKAEGGYRFFLSSNEHAVSLSQESAESYYFYLVHFGRDGKPCDLTPVKASALYDKAKLGTYVHIVRFDIATLSV